MREEKPEVENTANPVIQIAELILVIGFILVEHIIWEKVLKPLGYALIRYKNKFLNITNN